MHMAATNARGFDADYAAIDVPRTNLESFLVAALAAGVVGVNVTLPHKVAVRELVQRVSEEVERIGAANTLVRVGGSWVAHNTDARGFAMALQRVVGRDLSSVLDRVMLIGGGGAAQAAVAACEAMGAGRVVVAARTPSNCRWVDNSRATLQSLGEAWPSDLTLVVQATPLGLKAEDPSPVDATRFHPSMFAFDMCYGAHESRFLKDARIAGAQVEDGRRMLVAQGALAFAMWHGSEAPLQEMANALRFDW
jgi:shikimate dehydrogenase